jgi:MFS family permease
MKEHFLRLKYRTFWLWMHTFIAIFALSFVPLFLRENGYSLSAIILFYTLLCLGAVLLLPWLSTFNLRRSILYGYLCYAGTMLALLFGSGLTSYVLYIVFGAGTFVFFWIPFNYFFFNTTQKETSGTDSAFFFNSTAILGVFVPLLGAAMIKIGGYSWLFGLASLAYLFLGVYVYSRLPNENFTFHFRDCVTEFKGLKTISCLEGSLGFFPWIILGIYALLFFETASAYGYFLSYLGIIGLIIALLVTHHSDRKQKRLGYLFPLFFLMAVAIMTISLVHSTTYWIINVGIIYLLSNVSMPLRSAVCMDVKKVDFGFWKAKEFFTNIGRVITLGISALFFYYQLYWPVFVMYGLIALIYPFLVKYKFREMN